MLGVFGSFARDETSESSDIDLLVRFSKRNGLLAFIKLERELSDVFGKKVDLQTEAAISPYIREEIMNDLRVLYGSQ